MRVLLVGYGKMGRLVDELATAKGHDVVGRIDVGTDPWPETDVAIDFSTADALALNFPRYLERRVPVVLGTTGWSERLADYKTQAAAARLGVVAAANFSIGVNLFEMIVAESARLMQEQAQYGAWIHEAHHAAKRDAPSGTALLLRDAMVNAGYRRGVDISATRAGMIPGIHTIGFDSASDTIELTHTARDRRGFASGAIAAAEWLPGREGWFSMADVLGIVNSDS